VSKLVPDSVREEIRNALREEMAGRDDPEAEAFREAIRQKRSRRTDNH
jgi:hypothetical protein